MTTPQTGGPRLTTPRNAVAVVPGQEGTVQPTLHYET